jgi:hypothetical protein
MQLRDIDWSVLRGSLVFAVLALAVSTVLIGGGQWFHDQMRGKFEKEQKRFQSNSRRYLAVDEEERLISSNLPTYRALEQAGVVGDEQRLAWVETLREVSASLKLPAMRYEIMPQKEYQAPVAVSTGNLKVYGSPMKVHLGLLHEDDLFRFLDVLTSRSLGRFSVDRCALRRAAPVLQTDPGKANLEAECDLLWLTIRQPGDEKVR